MNRAEIVQLFGGPVFEGRLDVLRSFGSPVTPENNGIYRIICYALTPHAGDVMYASKFNFPAQANVVLFPENVQKMGSVTNGDRWIVEVTVDDPHHRYREIRLKNVGTDKYLRLVPPYDGVGWASADGSGSDDESGKMQISPSDSGAFVLNTPPVGSGDPSMLCVDPYYSTLTPDQYRSMSNPTVVQTYKWFRIQPDCQAQKVNRWAFVPVG